MMRWDIINAVIRKTGAKSYLEIGLEYGLTFDKIICERKIAVDPDMTNYFEVSKVGTPHDCLFEMSSDDYFAAKHRHKFDVIFIDGLHLANQVLKDINHSIHSLNDGGVIILHDCNPPTIEHGWMTPRIKRKAGYFVWCGTVWIAMMELQAASALHFNVIDTDWGVGVLRFAKDEKNLDSISEIPSADRSSMFKGLIEYNEYIGLVKEDAASFALCDLWAIFERNRAALLNLISVKEFNRRFNNGT